MKNIARLKSKNSSYYLQSGVVMFLEAFVCTYVCIYVCM